MERGALYDCVFVIAELNCVLLLLIAIGILFFVPIETMYGLDTSAAAGMALVFHVLSILTILLCSGCFK